MRTARCKIAWPTVRNIAKFLDEGLRVRNIRDASVNGLQVPPRQKGAVRKVGFAVDACATTFERAANQRVDLLVVHHGIAWRPAKDRDLERQRRAFLQKADIALYAAHLPLDLHEGYGNNAGLARILGMKTLRKFGRYHGIRIGYAGTLEKIRSSAQIAAVLERKLGTTCRVCGFGKKRVRSLGIVSGGGGDLLKEAVREGLDCFLVGEIDLAVYNAAREYGINVIAAGHYATETVGVKALMPVVADVFGVETVFVDDPKDL